MPERVAAVSSELSAATTRTLGFEALGDWSALLPNANLALSLDHTQGKSSLAVRGGGWMQIVSRKLDGTGPFPAVVGFDIKSPDAPVDSFWGGSVGLFLDAPASRVLPQFLGWHDLKSLGRGFHGVSFNVPDSVRRRLAGNYTDLRLSIVINAPVRERAAFLLDNFRLGAGTVPGCIPQDDANPCSDDACVANLPVHTPRAAGSNCDTNDDVCDGAARCDAVGACRTEPAPVLDDLNPCTVDACDAKLGVSHTAAPNGTACSDGNGCTLIDACQAGVCASGAPKTCLAVDTCHPAGTCQPSSGECSTPPATPGCGPPQDPGDPGVPTPEEALDFQALPGDFQPPTVEPTAVFGSVALLDPNHVLPPTASLAAAGDEIGAAIAGDLGGVSVEPSGPLSGVAYLRVALAFAGMPALWTKTHDSTRYRLQSLGRVIGGYGYLPIQHFSLQHFGFVPLPATPAPAVLAVPLPDQYGGVTPQNPDYAGPDYSWPWWDSGRGAASVSFNGVASLRSVLHDQSIVDPFPVGAGSRDGATLVDDLDGVVRKYPATVIALDDVCELGGDLVPASARVSAGAASVSWVVLSQTGDYRLCRMQLVNQQVESCALPTAAATDLTLAAHPGASLSEDGASLGIETSAALVADDANGATDVYVASLVQGQNVCSVELVGRDQAGAALPNGSTLQGGTRALSAHGRFVGFSTTELTPDDNEQRVLFVRDRSSRATRRAGTLEGTYPEYSDNQNWYRTNAWSLSDSGRNLAFRSAPTFEMSIQFAPDYSVTDSGLFMDVIDDRVGQIWPHHVDYPRAGVNGDCGALGYRAFDPTGSARYCESLRGPFGLSLSGDGHTVVFLANDGEYNYRPKDFKEAERYLQQRTPVLPLPGPPLEVPVGVNEMQGFEIKVGQVPRATARLAGVAGPDGDYYEFALDYESDGFAHLPFPYGVAGGTYSVSVVVDADDDLATVQTRFAGGFQIGQTLPNAALASAPLEYVATPLGLSNLATFQPGAHVELFHDDELLQTFPLPFTADASVTLPRLAEGDYELRVFVRVLDKDRLRLTLPLAVTLGFEQIGIGNSPSISDDGRLVAYCISDKLYIHDRPSRHTTTYDQPCDAARLTPAGDRVLIVHGEGKISFLRLLDLATNLSLFDYQDEIPNASSVTPSLGDWPFSDDQRYLAFEVNDHRTTGSNLQWSYVVDTQTGAVGQLLAGSPNLSGDGAQLFAERPYEYECDVNDNCETYEARPMRIPTSFLLSSCVNAVCFVQHPLYVLPERICPTDGSACFLNPLLPLPETPKPVGMSFHPDQMFLKAFNRAGDFVRFQVDARNNGAWRLWTGDLSSDYFTPAPVLGGYRFAAGSALLGHTAWLSAADFNVPSIQRFAQPGATGVPIVSLPAGATSAPSNLQVTPDQRLLLFTSGGTGLLDAIGQSPTSVSVPPQSFGTIYLARATPL